MRTIRVRRSRDEANHNDANDANIVVQDEPEGARVCGLFDFGDVAYSARVFEIAVAFLWRPEPVLAIAPGQVLPVLAYELIVTPAGLPRRQAASDERATFRGTAR